MTSRERLEATIRGEPVDRPGLSFYEIGGFSFNPDDPDPFNVYGSESWSRLLDLAETRTDLIRMRGPERIDPNPGHAKFFSTTVHEQTAERFTNLTLRIGDRELTQVSKRNLDIDTQWTIQHLLSSVDDLDAYLSLPDEIFHCDWSVNTMSSEDKSIGDRGIVMVDAADPLCVAASLFSMEDFLILALTEQSRMHRLLEKLAGPVYRRTEQTSRQFPGHLWRIFGPEYATEPYLPPRLFNEYVSRYTAPMVETIHRDDGFVRLHCHGRIASALPAMVEMGVDAIDPIEPPGQGDVELADVAAKYGQSLTLFGNIEVSEIEQLSTQGFRHRAREALVAGASARGHVLMPTASPCGREIAPQTMQNYETMVEMVNETY